MQARKNLVAQTSDGGEPVLVIGPGGAPALKGDAGEPISFSPAVLQVAAHAVSQQALEDHSLSARGPAAPLDVAVALPDTDERLKTLLTSEPMRAALDAVRAAAGDAAVAHMQFYPLVRRDQLLPGQGDRPVLALLGIDGDGGARVLTLGPAQEPSPVQSRTPKPPNNPPPATQDASRDAADAKPDAVNIIPVHVDRNGAPVPVRLPGASSSGSTTGSASTRTRTRAKATPARAQGATRTRGIGRRRR